MNTYINNSKYIVNVETKEERELSNQLIKVSNSINAHQFVDEPVLYLKPTNSQKGPIYQINKSYGFKPQEYPYEYGKTNFYVYDSIRKLVNTEKDYDTIYLVDCKTAFKEVDNKLYCTEFTILEKIDITPDNIFNKLKCSVDVMFKLANRNKELMNAIKLYIENNTEVNPDVLMYYTLLNYNAKNIFRLYNYSKPASFLEPLRTMPIAIPDTSDKRKEYVLRVLSEYRFANINNNFYDFSDFIIDFFSKYKLQANIVQDFILPDEEKILKWATELKDRSIKDHPVHSKYLNPFSWARDIGDKTEMLNKLSSSPIDSNTFNQIHSWLKHIGPNEQLTNKLFNSYVSQEDIVKLALDIGRIEECREKILSPIEPGQYKSYYHIDEYLNQPDSEYEYYDFSAILNFAEKIDKIMNNKSLYDRYASYILKLLCRETKVQDISVLFKKDYMSSSEIFYKWNKMFKPTDDTWDDIISIDTFLNTQCEPLIYEDSNKTADQYLATYISETMDEYDEDRLTNIFENGIFSPRAAFTWAQLVKTHLEDCFTKCKEEKFDQQLIADMSIFFNKENDYFINQLHDPYLKMQLIYASNRGMTQSSSSQQACSHSPSSFTGYIVGGVEKELLYSKNITEIDFATDKLYRSCESVSSGIYGGTGSSLPECIYFAGKDNINNLSLPSGTVSNTTQSINKLSFMNAYNQDNSYYIGGNDYSSNSLGKPTPEVQSFNHATSILTIDNRDLFLFDAIHGAATCNLETESFILNGANTNEELPVLSSKTYRFDFGNTTLTQILASISSQKYNSTCSNKYIAGGGIKVSEPLNIIEYFNSDTSELRSVSATLSYAKFGLSSCCSDSNIYFAGGINVNFTEYVDKYNMEADTTEQVVETLANRSYMSVGGQSPTQNRSISRNISLSNIDRDIDDNNTFFQGNINISNITTYFKPSEESINPGGDYKNIQPIIIMPTNYGSVIVNISIKLPDNTITTFKDVLDYQFNTGIIKNVKTNLIDYNSGFISLASNIKCYFSNILITDSINVINDYVISRLYNTLPVESLVSTGVSINSFNHGYYIYSNIYFNFNYSTEIFVESIISLVLGESYSSFQFAYIGYIFADKMLNKFDIITETITNSQLMILESDYSSVNCCADLEVAYILDNSGNIIKFNRANETYQQYNQQLISITTICDSINYSFFIHNNSNNNYCISSLNYNTGEIFEITSQTGGNMDSSMQELRNFYLQR